MIKEISPDTKHSFEAKIRELEIKFERGIREGKTFREMKLLRVEIKELVAELQKKNAARTDIN